MAQGIQREQLNIESFLTLLFIVLGLALARLRVFFLDRRAFDMAALRRSREHSLAVGQAPLPVEHGCDAVRYRYPRLAFSVLP